MDSALALKIELDSGRAVSEREAIKQLKQSELVTRLTADMVEKPLFYVWRLICLSEIPYAQHLDYTKNLIDRVYEKLSMDAGFSLSGDERQFLPCYNAMLVSAMCRLEEADSQQVACAVEWINRFQPMERGVTVSVPGIRFDRYGGCFNNTPCYIGVSKSVFALFDYQQATGNRFSEQKIEQGIEYILSHGLVYKIHHPEPITQHILDISFPETYHVNIVELIRFAARLKRLNDPRIKPSLDYLLSKQDADGCWKIDYRYKSEGYIAFDKARKTADWVTYVIRSALGLPIAP